MHAVLSSQGTGPSLHNRKPVNRKPKMKSWQVISAVMTSQDTNVYFTRQYTTKYVQV